jgi:hypothetical protein
MNEFLLAVLGYLIGLITGCAYILSGEDDDLES